MLPFILDLIIKKFEIDTNTNQRMNGVREKEIHLANISLIIVFGKFLDFSGVKEKIENKHKFVFC